MNGSLQELCQRMAEITGEFAENDDAVEELLSRDNAEDLLVALALSDGFIQGIFTLEPKAESHIRASEEELKEILQEFEESEEEEE
jgi:hypothetical protein